MNKVVYSRAYARGLAALKGIRVPPPRLAQPKGELIPNGTVPLVQARRWLWQWQGSRWVVIDG